MQGRLDTVLHHLAILAIGVALTPVALTIGFVLVFDQDLEARPAFRPIVNAALQHADPRLLPLIPLLTLALALASTYRLAGRRTRTPHPPGET